MKRFPDSFIISSLVLLCSLIFAAGCSRSSEEVKIPAKPNIIYILADDLGYGDLGCYGQEKINTPEIDNLAAKGMRFTQHYAGTSVCAPTRCSLMTGLHTGHTFIRANSPGYPGGQTPIPADTETIGKLFKRAGYSTACIGKWGLGQHYNSGAANKQGFDLFFGYYDQRHAHEYYTDRLYRNDQEVLLDGKTYSHDLLTSEALEYIEANKDGPFFLYLPYCIPHTKFQVPELGEYADKPWKENHKIQAAMITRMDRDVGRIVRRLEELGIDDNTLVMFSSDNGAHGQSGTGEFFKASGKLRGIKRALYEGGIRTPLVAYWPGIVPAGSVNDHVSAFWDMMPTFAALSGEEPKAEYDGISMLPALRGNMGEQKRHKYLYWELYEGGKHNRAVRMGKWKSVYPDLYVDDTFELYDLETDEGEATDVADSHPEIVEQLKALVKEAHVRSPLWNIESRGFDVRAACEATGIEFKPEYDRRKRK